MSYLSSLNVQCETIQTELDSQFVICPTPSENMPALQAILATQKAAGISQSVSDDSGKVKTIKVVYDQRALESAVTTETADRTCTTTNETFNNFTTYSIDPNTHHKYGEMFKIKDMPTVCQEIPAFMAKKINKVIDVLERKAATQVANELVALTGNFGTGVTVNGSNEFEFGAFISSATKAIDYTSISKIDTAFMLTGYCNGQIIVGGTEPYQYGQFIHSGCCSTSGVDVLDLTNKYGRAFMFDKRVATALGSQAKAVAFQPGSVALITYNQYDPTDLTGGSSNYSQIKVYSPRTGLPIDIVISDNCGVISIVGYITLKTVGLPTDMFAIGDEYRGVTFVNKLKIVNPD